MPDPAAIPLASIELSLKVLGIGISAFSAVTIAILKGIGSRINANTTALNGRLDITNSTIEKYREEGILGRQRVYDKLEGLEQRAADKFVSKEVCAIQRQSYALVPPGPPPSLAPHRGNGSWGVEQ